MIDNFSATLGKYRIDSIIKDMGWSVIPNCSEFEILDQGIDYRWKDVLGIKCKLPRKFKYKKGNNKKYNKYMEYQLKRLEKFRTEPRKYFNIVNKMLLYSVSFRMSAWKRIEPHWYSVYGVNKVRYINNNITKLIRRKSIDLIHRRVYIPKGETYRPLGVPTIEWRIILHMWNNFLFQFLRDLYLPSQHGFIKGRGTMTAWQEIFEKVLSSRYIFESDLKQFFPSVKHYGISMSLMFSGLPEHILRYIDGLNCSIPLLPKKSKRKLDESLTEEKRDGLIQRSWKTFSEDLLSEAIPKKPNVTQVSMKDLILPDNILKELDSKDNGINPPKVGGEKDRNYLVRDMFKKAKGGLDIGMGSSFGVPQGSPISPLISIVTLRRYLTQVPSVSFADDPVHYSDSDFKIENVESFGIFMHPEKSSWIKRDGIWLKKLTYLGLVYDPFNDILFKKKAIADDRIELSGEKVKELLKVFGVKTVEEKLPSLHNWSLLFSEGLMGKLISRIYENNWNRESFVNRKIKVRYDSLVRINKWSHRMRTATLSTQCYSIMPTILDNKNPYLKIKKTQGHKWDRQTQYL